MKTKKIFLTALFMAGVFALCAENPFLTFNPRMQDTVRVEKASGATGFFNVTSLDAGIGLKETCQCYSKRYYGVSNVTGYRFSEKIHAGAGVGLWLYNNGTLLPLFLNGRYYLSKKEVKPFIGGDAGTLIRIDGNERHPKLFGHPAAGVRIPLSGKMSVIAQLGLMTQFYEGSGHDSFLTINLGLGLH